MDHVAYQTCYDNEELREADGNKLQAVEQQVGDLEDCVANGSEDVKHAPLMEYPGLDHLKFEATMAKRGDRRSLQKHVKRLITLVTGIQEGDENFILCQQFAESNIKYHRYLSPDSHKIHRTIDGLCEKFQVHSQGEKAKDFKDLTTEFLDQPGLDGKSTGKTDVHYAMLSLLINLAEAPTYVDFQRKKAEVVAEEEDDFDWAGYLLEGEDLRFLSHASSESEEEEDEDDDEKDRPQKHVTHAECPNQTDEIFDKVHQGDSSSVLSGTPRGDVSYRGPATRGQDDYAELERALVVEYWRGKNTEEGVAGGHAACNTYKDWRSYQQMLNPFQSFSNKVLVTEPQVVRETLWMLSGVTDLFVFQHDGYQFLLNPDVYVLHLTPESLGNSLVPLMQRAQQIHILDTFIADTVSQRGNWTSSGDPPLQTYMHFANSISEFLGDFRCELVALEKLVMKQESNIPLSSLSSTLRPWLRKVEAVHKIFLHGITSGANQGLLHLSVTDGTGTGTTDSDGGNCLKATMLLDALYDSVLEADLMAVVDNGSMASLMLELLVKSSQPLLQIVSDWINNGILRDPSAEFVLQRNKEVKSLDETFWEKAFVPSAQSTRIDDPSAFNSFTTSPKQGRHEDSKSYSSGGKDRTTISQKQPWQEDDIVIPKGPKLLMPILREAILTGKSMEMLENLGRMGEALDVTNNIFWLYCGQRQLVHILKEEYDLMGYIHAMQRYYLMSSGEVMHDFYMPVFSKIESRDVWRDCSVLEMFLHDAVEPVFPQDVARLSVEIAGGCKKSAIGATDCIRLIYNVPWPVNVVISGRCQQLYNDVFAFILQIKRAKFTLDQLRFDDLCREQAVPSSARELFPDGGETTSRASCIHQFHLLRFRLLYFVNSVHNYIMTRIPGDKVFLIQLFPVESWQFRSLLVGGEVIQEMDSELTRCINFLSAFLQNVVKRGSYPHLESLAFAMASSLQSKLPSNERAS
ncbi:hypothetical protein EGW08_005744 [Elysia chlorotica]|uniref:Gamma-tubulin complex component n=1 Tax=Elysia chlorotica TaxID=188477 RepID=A0A3S1BEI3_ELYCH|nr:hypothetical protein EGW08_005744 [Elysia chlorotica]